MSKLNLGKVTVGTRLRGAHRGRVFTAVITRIIPQGIWLRYESGSLRLWSKSHIRKHYKCIENENIPKTDT